MKTKILFLQITMFLSIGLYSQETEMIDDVYFKPGSKSIVNNNDIKSKKVVKQQGKYLNGAKEIIFVDRDTVEVVTPDSKYLLAKANDSTEISQNNEDENGGHYLNEFNGSQSDLEYAERIRRFHNPKYTIFIGDPNYSDIYFLNNFDWNVYVDGSYAYVTPTWTNPYWFDYMYRPYSYNSWYWGNSWYSPYSCYGGWGYNNWGSPFYGGWGYNYWGSPYYGSWYGYGYGNYGWGYPYYGYHNHWGGSGYTDTNYSRRNDPMNNDANRRIAGTSRSNQGVSHRMEALTIGGGSRTSYSNRNTYTSLSTSNSRTTIGNNSGLRSETGLSGSYRSSNPDNTRSSSIRSTSDGMPTSNNRNSRYTTNDNNTNRSEYSTSTNRGTYNSSNRQTYSTGSRTGNISNSSSSTSYRSTAGSTAPRTNYSTGTPTRTYTESSSSRNTYQNNSVSSSRSSEPVSRSSYSGSSSSSSSGSSSSGGGSRSSGGGGGSRR